MGVTLRHSGGEPAPYLIRGRNPDPPNLEARWMLGVGATHASPFPGYENASLKRKGWGAGQQPTFQIEPFGHPSPSAAGAAD